jgi:HAMP domain-containing protein
MSRLSIRMRLLIVFMSLFTVALAGIFVWFYQFATDKAVNDMRQSLVDSASIAAGMIDPVEHTQVFTSGTQDDPQYTHIADQLRLVRDSVPNIGAIYTAVLSPNPDEVLFVVSASEDADRAGLREPYSTDDAPGMLTALGGQAVSDPGIGEDEFGIWLSGYAPIKDATGQTVAIVGVDMDAADVLAVQAQIRNVSILAFVVALIAVFGASYLLSGSITRSLRLITGAAQQLEKGEPFNPEQLKRVALGSDEVGKLAKVFSQMAVEVQSREKKLKEEVVQLRIEIDEVKKQKQIDEITDSEFFRDLKGKAKSMRQRASEDPDDSSPKQS